MKNEESPRRSSGGFSLIELMVAMGILSVLMLMMTVLIDEIQKSWNYSENRLGQFREARVAFDLMAKNIGQATLNTYWDLSYDQSTGDVDGYIKASELHFLTVDADELSASATQQPTGHAVFFQAPLGFSTNFRNLNNLFNGRGYFVAYGSDERFRPSFVDAEDRYRFRLMEFRPPAEENQVFADGLDERERNERQEFTDWFKHTLSVGQGDFEEHLNPLAENIITLIVAPRDSIESVGEDRTKDTYSRIARNYEFDSNTEDPDLKKFSQQVPPLVRVTMVAMDEASAVRLGNEQSMPDLVPDNLFDDTENYEADVIALSDHLNNFSMNGQDMTINHRVFSTLVLLRSAKWSTLDLD